MPTGTSGLILLISPPTSFIALRKEAKSTTAGTPVKSCKITLEGLNGTSPSLPAFPNLLNVLLESVLRQEDDFVITDDHIKALSKFGNAGNEGEVPFKPSRVML
jgi:hypothetical protein